MDTKSPELPPFSPHTPSATIDVTNNRSHMARRLENQSKKTLILTGLGTILLIALCIIYGPMILIQMSLLTTKTTDSETTSNTPDQTLYIAPPILDPHISATNSASLQLTGQASDGDEIKLYRGDEIIDVAKPKHDGSFTFDDVILKEGMNTLKAIAFRKDKKSGYSNTIFISYLKEPPSLTIDTPNDGDTYSGPDNRVSVKGKTDQDVTVKVQDFLAVMKTDGNFSYTFPLQNGDNTIKVTATDKAGNKTEKEIIVKYAP